MDAQKWTRIYPSDVLTAREFALLDPLTFGVYFRLELWAMRWSSLPNDLEELAHLAGCTHDPETKRARPIQHAIAPGDEHDDEHDAQRPVQRPVQRNVQRNVQRPVDGVVELRSTFAPFDSIWKRIAHLFTVLPEDPTQIAPKRLMKQWADEQRKRDSARKAGQASAAKRNKTQATAPAAPAPRPVTRPAAQQPNARDVSPPVQRDVQRPVQRDVQRPVQRDVQRPVEPSIQIPDIEESERETLRKDQIQTAPQSSTAPPPSKNDHSHTKTNGHPNGKAPRRDTQPGTPTAEYMAWYRRHAAGEDAGPQPPMYAEAAATGGGPR